MMIQALIAAAAAEVACFHNVVFQRFASQRGWIYQL